MDTRKKKNQYQVYVNRVIKNKNICEYSFGNTKGIKTAISEQGAGLFLEMSVLYSIDDFISFKNKLFRDWLRKIHLLYPVIFKKPLVIKKIIIRINVDEYIFDAGKENFPFMFSMLESGNYCDLTDSWADAIPNYILKRTKSQSDWNHKNCAMQAYLLSKTRKYENDRFLNLWTAMNALYNQIAFEFETRYKTEHPPKPNKKYSNKVYKIDNPSLGAFITVLDDSFVLPKKPDEQKEYILLYKNINRLFTQDILKHLDELYYETEANFDNAYNADNKFKELYALADTVHMPLYIVLLLLYPYYIRCNIFHGSKVQAIVTAYNDPEIKDYAVVNYFLDQFLNTFIPKIFSGKLVNDKEYDAICHYLNRREKKG